MRLLSMLTDSLKDALKNIVEENNLIDITWEYFWGNFDCYIKEYPEEANSLNIKDRNSIKAYFHYYSYKHHPKSSNGVVYAYDCIETSISFCSLDDTYLGYYNLMFDLNLNILDDFFVIE